LYGDVGFGARIMSVGRPWLCPLHVLLGVVPAGTSILDIGCGSGVFLNLLADQARISRGVGVDSSSRAIAAARVAHDHIARTSVAFELRRVEEGLPQGRYGVVSMIDVLHHIPQPAQRDALMAAASRVADGGVLLFKDVGLHPRWRAWASRLHDLAVARQWIHIVAPALVEAWMLAAGFELIHRQTINILWYGHELLVFRKVSVGAKVAL
jgi:2-polyprenyl-3-methyl-5-hydroxy-6-metoxy-1,4-benzoquinol methylase